MFDSLSFTPFLHQHGRLLQLECALPQPALVPERMTMREAVSEPFELVVECLAPSIHFDCGALVGEQLSLRLLQPDGRYKPWHGYVFEAGPLGSDGGAARWRLVMRPWLAFLSLRHDSAVFQDKTSLEIAQALFAHHPQAHWRCEVSEPLRRRSVCIQYRQSDLGFLARLLAEDGLAYHFEHLQGDATEAADAAGHARHVLVICDRSAERADLGPIRFTTQHVTARAAGQRDSITAFAARRSVQPNAVTLGSWDYQRAAGTSAQAASALDLGELPALEHYDGTGAYRYENTAHAERAAELALAACELDVKRFEGQGSARHLSAGSRFSLVDHPLYGANTTAFTYAGALLASQERPDNAFTVLAVEHHATNNLGADIARLLEADDEAIAELEHGSYKNRFHCAPAAAAVVPRFVRQPTAPGAQTALVVGLPGEAVTTERDLRVKLQFPWQRGAHPNPGGLPASGPDEGAPAASAAGHAPGDDTSGTWVRVALPSAGANWGAVFVPRLGAEVLVEFIEGDIDRPIVTGQLYNGQDGPPFAAGVDTEVNHPGVIDGIHSTHLDGGGFNQWVLDNATGQLRMRLLASHATSELSLGHLIRQAGWGAQRGEFRGTGFEAATQGWASVRAAAGLLLSATARAGSYGSAQSTQMDAAEAVAQLKGARDLGRRLDEMAKSSGAPGLASHRGGGAFEALTKAIDGAQDGRHPDVVNGQAARKVRPGSRELDEPVEAFAQPVMVLDTPSSAAFASEAGIAAYAGQDLSLAAQGDVHHAAAHTHASVSGGATSWMTHAGGVKAIAAQGDVSLRAHTDGLQILADDSVTIVSVGEEIRIFAKERIELVAGESRIVLDGGDIEFACPGHWQAKGSLQAFLPGESGAALIPDLPAGQVAIEPQEASVRHLYHDDEAVHAARYTAQLGDGSVRNGSTDVAGFARLSDSPPGPVAIRFEPDGRSYQRRDRTANDREASIDALIARHAGKAGPQT